MIAAQSGALFIWRLALVVICLAPLAAAAEAPRVEIAVSLAAPSRELMVALRAGLRQWSVRVAEQQIDGTCTPLPEQSAAHTTVLIRWEREGPALLCFATRHRAVTRELGPFPELHARAREELVTVIEAGLETLLSPPLEAADDSSADGGPSDSTQGSGQAERELAWRPSAPQSLAANPSAFAEFGRFPRAADGPAGGVADASATWTLGAGYSPTLWATGVTAQGVTASATRSVDARHLFHLGARVLYVPGVRVERQDLSLLATEFQTQLMFGIVAPLFRALSFESAVGAGFGWLLVSPQSSPAWTIRNAKSRSHFDPLLTLVAGPRLGLATGVSLSAQVGCNGTLLTPRPLGYEGAENDNVSVLQMRQLRLFFEVGARIGL